MKQCHTDDRLTHTPLGSHCVAIRIDRKRGRKRWELGRRD